MTPSRAEGLVKPGDTTGVSATLAEKPESPSPDITMPQQTHPKPIHPAIHPKTPPAPLSLQPTQHPTPNLPSRQRQHALATLLVLANFTPMLSFGAGIGGGLHIASMLGVTQPSQASWIAASYPLTAGAFILCSGRLGAIYGHKRTLLLGAAGWTVCTLATGFCGDFVAFNVARGLSGVGSALVVPNAVAVVGITFPPGRMRNRCLGLFGAGAPAGGWAGALLAGLLAEKVPGFEWLFVVMALLGTLVFGSLALVLPRETPVCAGEEMDWVGSLLGIGGLIVFNFVWNQAPKAGWSSPYEIALLILSILLFLAFSLWELKYAAHPIMPLTIWRAPSFAPVIIVVLFSFMSYGSFIWYLVAWQQNLRHWSVLSTALGLTPLAIFSIAGAFLAAWLVPRLSVQWILVIGALAVLVAEVLVATMPQQQRYWTQMFPATIIQSFCPDFIFTAAQIVACSSVGRKDQGVAGSLIGTLQLYATSIGLGFAGIVETRAAPTGAAPVEGYRAALCFGGALAVVALVISVVFVRMPKDTREGWQDEEGVSGVGVPEKNIDSAA